MTHVKVEAVKKRTHETIMLSIYRNKSDKYQFVNDSRHHICPCEFDDIEAALCDLMKYKDEYDKMTLYFYG